MKNSIPKMTISVLVAGSIMVALSAACNGQGANYQPHFPGQAPGEKQSVVRQIQGTVGAVDSQGTTLTIESSEGEKALKVTSKTKFTHNASSASIHDAAAGKSVTVVIKMVNGEPDEVVSADIK